MCIQPDEEHGMGVIGLVKSIRCESTSEPAQDAPRGVGWRGSCPCGAGDAGQAVECAGTNGCQLRHDVPFLGRDDDDGHHSLRGFDMLGSFRDWRRCGEFQDRIRAGYAELLKPCAERAPDEGDIEDKVLAPTNARTLVSRASSGLLGPK